jgi:hypothetical protein
MAAAAIEADPTLQFAPAPSYTMGKTQKQGNHHVGSVNWG